MLDIGCGDGRILLEWAERISRDSTMTRDGVSTLSFLGIDIDPDRIEQCQHAADEAKSAGRVLLEIKLDFVCANALESVELFQNATVVFLYLIPRGLKQIYPLLKEHSKRRQEPIRIVTYMSKLPSAEIAPTGRALCRVEHQQEAAWPLYFYVVRNETGGL